MARSWVGNRTKKEKGKGQKAKDQGGWDTPLLLPFALSRGVMHANTTNLLEEFGRGRNSCCGQLSRGWPRSDSGGRTGYLQSQPGTARSR